MAKQPRSLSGRTAVVTGGARGIGRAITEALIAKGVRVAIGDVDREAAERTAAELGDAVVGLPLDVTDLAGFTAFLDDVERRLGPIDILVNNAGIMPITPLEAGVGGEHHAPAGDQPARGDPRHPGVDAPDAPARHRPHRQHRLAGGQGRLPQPRHLRGDQARGRRALGGRALRAQGLGRRGLVRDAGDRQHGALERHAGGARRQEPHAGGGRGRGRRRARGPALRRLRPALDRAAAEVRRDPAAPRPRGDGARDARRPAWPSTVDLSKRAAYESRVAASGPTADKVAEVQLDQERTAA